MTPDAAWSIADLPGWSFAFVLVLARVGAAMTLLPGLGEASLPTMVRIGLTLCLTVLLLPAVAPAVPAVPEASLVALRMLVAEAVTGFCFGWLARVLCLALPIAAQFIAYLLGISSVLQPDAELGPQTTALARLFELGVPVVVLASGLYALPLSALAGSYRLIPPGVLLPVADGTGMAVAVVTQAFALALRLAAPFLLSGIVWNLAVGLIARLVPRLQVYFVSLPGQILGGLVLLASLFGVMLATWHDAVRDGFAALPGN